MRSSAPPVQLPAALHPSGVDSTAALCGPNFQPDNKPAADIHSQSAGVLVMCGNAATAAAAVAASSPQQQVKAKEGAVDAEATEAMACSAGQQMQGSSVPGRERVGAVGDLLPPEQQGGRQQQPERLAGEQLKACASVLQQAPRWSPEQYEEEVAQLSSQLQVC